MSFGGHVGKKGHFRHAARAEREHCTFACNVPTLMQDFFQRGNVLGQDVLELEKQV